MSTLSDTKTAAFIGDAWKNSVLPALCEFITVPNVSPDFDAAFNTNGFQVCINYVSVVRLA